jgi:glycosyltransferase involved in cell wall biosynthesis
MMPVERPSCRPLLSLVVATKGRTQELETLLASLRAQSFRDFDVLVVDQNPDGRLEAMLAKDWGVALRRLHRPADIGVSCGRNVGWRASDAEFLLFPDDDCWYPPGFLAHVAQRLAETRVDVLSGRAADEQGRSINGRFQTRPTKVGRDKVWTTQIEWVAVFRRSLVRTLDGYDPDLGVGALTPWQSCEAQDIILRALKTGAACWYDPDLFGHHAELRASHPDAAMIRKGREYGRGMGYVLRLHGWGWGVRLYWVARPALRAALSLLLRNWSEARYAQQVAIGRLEGASARLLTRPRTRPHAMARALKRGNRFSGETRSDVLSSDVLSLGGLNGGG